MDVEELTGLARALGRAEFGARFPHLFLLFHEDKDAISAAQFETQVASRASALPLAGALRVLPVVKRPTNPYTDRISIGRARNCDVVLRHASVSKLHAHVRREPDGGWILIDNGSHNGTAIGTAPVTADRPARLASGDLVTLGGVTVRVVDADELHHVLTRLMGPRP